MGLKSERSRLRFKDIESVPAFGAGRRTGSHATALEPPANEERGMGSQPIPVGDELRRAREAAGLEISDVAAHLRIRSNFLTALEEGRPDALPGVTYAIGYVRTYSGFLGLDPDNAVRRFKEEAAGLNSKPELIFPSPAPEGRVPGVAVMLVALMLAGGAYGGWYWVSERDGGLHDLVPLVPERLAQLIEGDAPSLPNPTADTASQPGAAPTARSTSATYAEANPAGTVQPSPRVPPAAADRAAPPPGVSVAPTVSPVPAKPAPARPDSGSPLAVKPVPTPVVAAKPTAATPTVTSSATTTPAVTAPAATAAPEATPPQAAVEPAPADPSATTAEDTPDVTDLPEPADSAQADTVAPRDEPAAPVAKPIVTDQDVPAAPRIAGLIGASEAAVPTDRTTAGTIDRIMIRATGDSWVQVRDAEGTALFTRVLREGDVYRVPSKVGLKLATGNAGALDILVDGNPAPSIGGFGEVVRNITLDPARLAAGTAASVAR